MKPKNKIRVMVVDDEDHVRKLIVTVVKTLNCEIVGEAANGREAVSKFSELKPHMLLLDINMPLKSGKKALAEIKKDPDLRRIPIVVLTTSQKEEDIQDTYEMGITGFITKPMTFSGLVDVMKSVGNYWLQSVTLPSQ